MVALDAPIREERPPTRTIPPVLLTESQVPLAWRGRPLALEHRAGSTGFVLVSRLRQLVRETPGSCEGFGKWHACPGREVARDGGGRTLGCMGGDSSEREERLDLVVCDGRRAESRCVPVEPTTSVECHDRRA